MTIRPATVDDLPRVAELHVARISEGFLQQPRHPVPATPLPARCADRHVVHPRRRRRRGCRRIRGRCRRPLGLLPLVHDSRRRRRRRDGSPQGGPRGPRVIETLKYPSATGEFPDAEILAVAVAIEHTGRGLGTALVRAATTEFLHRNINAAKVVTTADNIAALAMYHAAGYQRSAELDGARGALVRGLGVDGVVALAIGLIGGLILTPIARRVAFALDIVDRPGELKTQRVPIAYLGGIAVALAAASGPLLAGRAILLIPMGAALALGLADDLRPLAVPLPCRGRTRHRRRERVRRSGAAARPAWRPAFWSSGCSTP